MHSYPRQTPRVGTCHSSVVIIAPIRRTLTANSSGVQLQQYPVIISYNYQSKSLLVSQQAWLALLGVLCIGLAIGVSFGLSSAFGASYGPVHPLLPFLLLGKIQYISCLCEKWFFIEQRLLKLRAVRWILDPVWAKNCQRELGNMRWLTFERDKLLATIVDPLVILFVI